MASLPLVPAAQYLRMSTEHQQYSISNQKDALARYAAQHGFEIVRTYSDPGRTGVTLRHRPGLKTLLQEVVSEYREYAAILVYDISRWGRFQNTDEAAHYEYICAGAGVKIHYCAEEFSNDDSTQSALMKALKRSMAAEYSRELSVKVFAGQKRLARMGYWVGALPGYGLKRMLVGPDGSIKQELRRGERKNVDTDRVILAPGPSEEVRNVREVFRLCAEGELPTAIAHRLNVSGHSRRGDPWTYESVMRILTNPKYAGIYIWARRSCKLGSPLLRNYPEEWSVNETTIKPIVSKSVFDRAQLSLHSRSTRTPSSKLLAEMLVLLKKKGRLTQAIVHQARNVRSRTMFKERFGSLLKMYDLLGYKYPKLYVKMTERMAATYRLREQLFKQIETLFQGDIFRFKLPNKDRWLLRLSNGTPLSVLIGERLELLSGRTSWYVSPKRCESRFVTLLCLRNSTNDGFEHFYVLPGIDRTTAIRTREGSSWLERGERLERLKDLLKTVGEVSRRMPPPQEPQEELLGIA